jgi:hypothetical protein
MDEKEFIELETEFDQISFGRKNKIREETWKKYPEFYNKIIEATNFCPIETPIWARMLLIKSRSLEIPKCKICLNLAIYQNEWETCSKKCKTQQTCLEKYGVTHTAKLESTRKKCKQTCLDNFGFEFPAQSKEIREKTIKTNLRNFGVSNPMFAENIKEKMRATFLENR